MTAGLELRDVTMRFGETAALAGIGLTVAAGRYAVLLGPSGCGKSTLLGILGGFLAPTSGAVLIGGRDVTALPPAKRPTTTVFQDYALFPHMTLAENVGFGLRMRGVAARARRARAEEMLALVGLDGAADRRPDMISGGQRQRVALARALAVDPDILLLDEPLGALDLKLRRSMQDELKAIQHRLGTTFVHVTHDQEEAMSVGDEIVVMRAGRIEDQGDPAEIYRRPRSLFSAAFMGEVNLVRGTWRSRDAAAVALDTAVGRVELTCPDVDLAPGAAVTLVIRPEHFRDGGALTLGAAKVEALTHLGTHIRAQCRLGDQTLLAHFAQATRLAPGDEVALGIDPARITLLPGHPE